MTALVQFLDWFGIAVFAATGALVASRKQMDIFGFALLGTVTGVAAAPFAMFCSASCRCSGYIGRLMCSYALPSRPWCSSPHTFRSRAIGLLLWFDAAGLALFASIGAEKGLEAGAGPVVAVFMGIITATFGGIIRDVLGGEVPLILRKEIYVTAALLGAATFVTAMHIGLPRSLALGLGFAACFALRALALRYGWSLPPYRGAPRPEMSRTGPHSP